MTITETMVERTADAILRRRIEPNFYGVDANNVCLYDTDKELAVAALTAALSDMVVVPRSPTVDDLEFANQQNIKAARKYKARLEYMEAKYGKIDWDAAPPPSDQVGGWQDIATAPKDGTQVLLFRSDGKEVRAVGFYDPAWKSWVTVPGRYGWTPTHWQPLPAPPPSSPVSGGE